MKKTSTSGIGISIFILVSVFILFIPTRSSAQWVTVNLIDFNGLTYESDYTTNGIAYYDNAVNPSTGPRNGLINGTWEVSNTNLGATQSPSNASGGRFLMYWTDERYTYPGLPAATAPTGIVFSKTYTGLTIGKTYRYSFKYGYLVQTGGSTTGAPSLSILLDGNSVKSLSTPTTTWATTPYVTFIATKTSHTLAISNSATNEAGNDLGLDDILLETNNIVVPLKLLSFTGKVQENGIELNWHTTNEVNVKQHIVQRSNDGIHYTDINVVAAQNQLTDNYYKLTDNAPASGVNYYRLKSVDLDGTYSVSNIVSFKYNAARISVTAYPNPVQDLLNIRGIGAGAVLQLYSMDGRLLVKQSMATRQQLDLTRLTAGSYRLVIYTSNENVFTQTIVKK